MREKLAEAPRGSTSATGGAGARGARLAPPCSGVAVVDGMASQHGAGRHVLARSVAEDAPSTASLFATEHAGGFSVALGKGETLSTIARRYYGHQEAEWIRLLMEANGMSQRDVSRLRPGQGILVPAVRRPADRPAPEARSVAADQLGVVPIGQLTFDAEGQEAPGRSTHSRKPHVPTDSSGVTIGRGFDMSKRRTGQVRSQLEAAGVPRATASSFAGAATLTGADARAFARQHATLEVTPAQQWNLFVQEYHRIAATTQLDILRWELSRPAEERLDPAGLDVLTSELLVDLRFRGDLTSRTWSLIRPHVNDAAALGQIFRQRSNFPRVPRDRYERRCRRLGVEPEPEPAPAQQVQRARAGHDALAGTAAPPIVHAALAAPSQPLAPELRQRMEAHLGHDFGVVRVHTDLLADASARAVGALAYTVGEHVVFRARAFAPETAAGRELLAHELVHVTQQPPLGVGVPPDLVIGDPHAAAEHDAQRLASDHRAAAPATSHAPSGSPSVATLRRQTASESSAPAAAAGVSRDVVLTRVNQFTGLPYAFSESDTVNALNAKIKQLQDDLKALPAPPAGAPAAEKDKYAAQKKQLEADIASAWKELPKAQQEYGADAIVMDVLRERQGPELAPELAKAVRLYGVVCNTFVELVMRTSGFADFPVTDEEYAPKTAKYREIEAAFNKEKGHTRSGWGLEWAHRIVDWAAAQGTVLYDDTDASRKELPTDPQPGDIVIFLRPNGRHHISMVVADRGGFNFAGARSSGKKSGTSLTTPFKSYADQFRGKTLPKIMGQEKYLWIVRPTYATPAPVHP